MRVGLDVTAAVRQGGGIGRYVRELLRALAELDQTNDYQLLITSRARPHPLPPLPANFRLRAIPIEDVWFARLWHRAQVPLPVNWLTGQIDLFHSPDFTLPPVSVGTRTVLTVHDLTFRRDPESATPELRQYLERVVPRSVAHADHILADSVSTHDDLIELYHAPSEKISVLYSGVNDTFRPITDETALRQVRVKYRLGSEPFILAVGTLQPRKNFARLIQALAQLPDREVKLVLAGGRGWLYESIFAEVERLQLQTRVVFPGFVEDADLPALYSAARVLAYPSLYEGFGLPILEAMACGTPVVTSNVSCLPEVAGDAALSVAPTDVTALAEALHRALSDEALRATLTARGAERARQFSWATSAQQLLRTYQRLS